MNKFLKYYYDVIKESPHTISSYIGNDLDDSTYNHGQTLEVVNNYSFVEKISGINGPVDLYINPNDKGDWYLIQQSQKIIGYLRFNLKDKYAELVGVWNNKDSKGSCRKVFIDYFLPKYNTIISDSVNTPEGNNFWKKIIEYGLTNNKEVGIFYFDKNNFIPVKSVEELNSSYLWDEVNERLYIRNR